jgi:hypothetical protein
MLAKKESTVMIAQGRSKTNKEKQFVAGESHDEY